MIFYKKDFSYMLDSLIIAYFNLIDYHIIGVSYIEYDELNGGYGYTLGGIFKIKYMEPSGNYDILVISRGMTIYDSLMLEFKSDIRNGKLDKIGI